MPTSLDSVLRDHGGVVHIQDLLAAGYTRHQVARLHRIGRLHRPRIGWYVAPSHSAEVMQAIRVGGALACVSAAESFGCSVPPDPRVHVALPRHAARLRSAENGFLNVAADESGVVRHWVANAPSDRFRVGLIEALDQVFGCLEPAWAIAVLDSARRQRPEGPALLAASDFAAVVSEAGRERSRLLRLSSTQSESVLESVVRVRLAGAGFAVTEQVEIGRYRADLIVEGALVIECDGFTYHGDRAAFEYDRRRDAAFTAAGFAVLRLSYRRITQEWPTVLGEIRAAVGAHASRIRKSG